MSDVDYSSNANQRTPCLPVLDVSGSMETVGPSGKTRIQALNEGLALLEKSLKEDDMAISRVQLAIVSVGGPNNDADVMMDWTDVVNFKAFPLRTGGSTPLGKGVQVGLQLIEEAKDNLRDAGINYTRPWMMIISDGEPTDDKAVWASAARESRAAEATKKVEVFCIGVEGANLSILGELGTKPALMLEGIKFKELFVWLSNSLSAASRSRPGDTLALADTGVWRNVRM